MNSMQLSIQVAPSWLVSAIPRVLAYVIGPVQHDSCMTAASVEVPELALAVSWDYPGTVLAGRESEHHGQR